MLLEIRLQTLDELFGTDSVFIKETKCPLNNLKWRFPNALNLVIGESINQSVKVFLVFLRLRDCPMCLEQNDGFQINVVFRRDLLFVLIENECLQDT